VRARARCQRKCQGAQYCISSSSSVPSMINTPALHSFPRVGGDRGDRRSCGNTHSIRRATARRSHSPTAGAPPATQTLRSSCGINGECHRWSHGYTYRKLQGRSHQPWSGPHPLARWQPWLLWPHISARLFLGIFSRSVPPPEFRKDVRRAALQYQYNISNETVDHTQH